MDAATEHPGLLHGQKGTCGPRTVNLSAGRTTLGAVTGLQFLRGAVEGLVGASLPSLVASLGLASEDVPQLLVAEATLRLVAAPAWAILASALPRRTYMAATCLAWGVLTACMAACPGFKSLLVVVTLRGATLPALVPLVQNTVHGSCPPPQRGSCYGMMQAVLGCGHLSVQLGGAAAAWVCPPAGPLAAWRLLALACCLFCFVEATSILLFSVEVHDVEEAAFGRRLSHRSLLRSWREWLHRSLAIAQVPSFAVLMAHGLVCAGVANVMSLVPSLIHQCRQDGALLVSAVLLSSTAGPLLGGVLGDRLGSGEVPGADRSLLLAVSAGATAVPFLLLVFGAPLWTAPPLALLACLLGLTSGWTQVGARWPIVAEVVAAEDQALAATMLVTVEAVFGALVAAPAVGAVAEVAFGYRVTELGTDPIGVARRGNAKALQVTAMCLVIPLLAMEAGVFYPALKRAYSTARRAVALEDGDKVDI